MHLNSYWIAMNPTPKLLVIALTLALAGCNNGPGEIELLQRAETLEAKGDFKTSIIELKNLLQINPDNAQARLMLGQIYLKTGQGAEAEKELVRAHKLGVGADTTKPLVAQSLIQQREYERLFKDVSLTGNEAAPAKSRILSAYGEAKLNLRNVAEGCAFYKDAAELDKRNLSAQRGLVNCDYVEGRTTEARNRLDSLIKSTPSDAANWLLLGDIEYAAGNTDAAMQAYGNAAKYAPNNVDALYKQAAILLPQRKTDQIGPLLAGIKKASPGHYLADYLDAQLAFLDNKDDIALEAVVKSLKKRDDNVPAYLLLGLLQYNKKFYGQAAKTLNAYLQLAPESIDARKVLAASYLKLAEPQKSLDTLKPLLLVRRDDAQVFALAAEAHLALKEPGAATDLFARASDLVPSDTALRTQLALSQLAQGDTGKAVAELERAATSQAGDRQAGFLLALHHIQQQQPDQALDILTKMEAAFPKDPSLLNLKGFAYTSKKDYLRARSYFEKSLAVAPGYFSAVRNLAQLDINEGKPEAARNRYLTQLKQDKKNVRAMMALAGLASDTKGRISWIEQAIEADPKALPPRQALALEYIDNGQTAKALSLARAAHDAQPDSNAALEFLGKTQLAAGELENARASFTRLVQAAPNSASAHYHLGLSEIRLNRADAARTALQNALKKQADYLPAQETLVALETAAGRSADALRIAADVLRQRPSAATGPALEGDIYLSARDYAQAAKRYEAAYGRAPSNTLAIKLHRALALGGNTGAADAVAEKWLKSHPDDVLVQGYLARYYLNTGRDREAITTHEWLRKRAPKDARILNNLAWLYQKTGDTRALDTAKAALELAPDSPAMLDTLGWILFKQGNTARAQELLARAVKLDPASPGARYHYAAVLAQTGNTASARQELNRALASKRDFPERSAAQALLGKL